MRHRYSLFIALFLIVFLTNGASAQWLSGKVLDSQQKPVAGAFVRWLGTSQVVYTDSLGVFQFLKPLESKQALVVSATGFSSDTIQPPFQDPLTIRLRSTRQIRELQVVAQQEGVRISDLNPIKTEQISRIELGKAACCDLAGCFETQSTVQPQVTNVITNAKELRILGLSGVYNQVLIDGFPLIQGLSYTYGISSVPGSLVENIFIAKGANSVLQGFESISGQINVETKSPDKTDKLFANLYVNNFQEKHVNFNYAFKKEGWSNLSALHVVLPAARFDRDDDRFLDLPLLTRYLFTNRWKYGQEKNWGWNSQVNFRMLHEQRVGGQTSFDPNRDRGSSTSYGQWVKLSQPEFWSKTSFRFNDVQQITAFASGFVQQQNAWFGTVNYQAAQVNGYLNLQHEFNHSNGSLKSGLSLRYLKLNETIAFSNNDLARTFSGDYRREEIIPGVFAEHTWRLLNNRLSWITGLRADFHNQFGTFITPRTLLKYDLTPTTIVRTNIGTGWRTVNLFSENIGLLVSSRNLLFAEALEPEQAVNAGINLTQKYSFFDKLLGGYLSIDYYRTEFSNQVFPDYDSDPTKAIITNFRGQSISESFQVEGVVRWQDLVEWKVGYSWVEVYRMVSENRQELPFNPRHKVMSAISIQPKSKRFQFDINAHWYGSQRLPDTRLNPEVYQRPSTSPTYSIINTQITYRFQQWEVYTGCENLFDFRQLQPILGWQDPFGRYFDTSFVWGPTRGREFYLGIRYRVK